MKFTFFQLLISCFFSFAFCNNHQFVKHKILLAQSDENGDVEYQGFESNFEDLPGGYYDKYIDCGINEHLVRGRNMSIEEMDKMCEELKQARQKKNIQIGFGIFGILIAGIVVFKMIKKALTPGIEFQKMAVSFNGLYGVLNDLQENINSYQFEEIRKEILFCAFISQKEIIRPLNIYNWNEFTPIIVPLISDKKINVKIAMKKTVDTVKRMSIELGLETETNDIFSEGELFKQFEKEQQKEN